MASQGPSAAAGGPLVALAGAVSKLVGRAIGACLASAGAPEDHTVVLELQQRPQSPGTLGLRVCDDGLPLPEDSAALERWAAQLALPALLSAPLFLDSTLLVQTTGLEEAVVRRYSLRSAGPGQPLTAIPAEAAPKPPGSGLHGSVVEATVRLQQHPEAGADGSGRGEGGRQYIRQLLGGTAATPQAALPPSAEAVVGCLQQLLGMVRVLAPPVRLMMRLDGVLLQAPDGSLQPVSGSRRLDLPLAASLEPLARFGEGMASEFLPPEQTGGAGAGAESVLDDSALMSASSAGGGAQASQDSAAAEATSGGGAAAAPAAPAAAVPQSAAAREAEAAEAAGGPGPLEAGQPPLQPSLQPPPLLTYVGVGEAGWGCPGAAQQFRGCKWTAGAGLVLRMPDHARLRQLQRQQRQAEAQQRQAGGGGGAGGGSGGAAEPPGGDRSGPSSLPVYLFRSWALQQEGQAQVIKGLGKVDWPNFGFSLEGQPQCGADGALAATLRCAQPESGARLEAVVVHLSPCEHRSAAEGGKAPGLAAGYEARLVRAAVEGALQQLKQQCPAVVCSRRERSLGRALPLLSEALAGILLASERAAPDGSGGGLAEVGGGGFEGGLGGPDGPDGGGGGSALQQACAMAGCEPEGLEAALDRLLHDTVTEALGEAGAEGGSKRARRQQPQAAPAAAEPEALSQSQA